MRVKDLLIFLFNFISGWIFALLAFNILSEQWWMWFYPVLLIPISIAEFLKIRRDIIKENNQSEEHTTIFSKDNTIWPLLGSVLYLFLYYSISISPDFLYYAVLCSAFCILGIYDELWRTMGRVAASRL